MTLICYQYGAHTSPSFKNTPLYLAFCCELVKSTGTSKNGTYSIGPLSQLSACHAPTCHSRSFQPTFIDAWYLPGTAFSTKNTEMTKVIQGSLANGVIDVWTHAELRVSTKWKTLLMKKITINLKKWKLFKLNSQFTIEYI